MSQEGASKLTTSRSTLIRENASFRRQQSDENAATKNTSTLSALVLPLSARTPRVPMTGQSGSVACDTNALFGYGSRAWLHNAMKESMESSSWQQLQSRIVETVEQRLRELHIPTFAGIDPDEQRELVENAEATIRRSGDSSYQRFQSDTLRILSQNLRAVVDEQAEVAARTGAPSELSTLDGVLQNAFDGMGAMMERKPEYYVRLAVLVNQRFPDAFYSKLCRAVLRMAGVVDGALKFLDTSWPKRRDVDMNSTSALIQTRARNSTTSKFVLDFRHMDALLESVASSVAYALEVIESADKLRLTDLQERVKRVELAIKLQNTSSFRAAGTRYTRDALTDLAVPLSYMYITAAKTRFPLSAHLESLCALVEQADPYIGDIEEVCSLTKEILIEIDENVAAHLEQLLSNYIARTGRRDLQEASIERVLVQLWPTAMFARILPMDTVMFAWSQIFISQYDMFPLIFVSVLHIVRKSILDVDEYEQLQTVFANAASEISVKALQRDLEDLFGTSMLMEIRKQRDGDLPQHLTGLVQEDEPVHQTPQPADQTRASQGPPAITPRTVNEIVNMSSTKPNSISLRRMSPKSFRRADRRSGISLSPKGSPTASINGSLARQLAEDMQLKQARVERDIHDDAHDMSPIPKRDVHVGMSPAVENVVESLQSPPPAAQSPRVEESQEEASHQPSESAAEEVTAPEESNREEDDIIDVGTPPTNKSVTGMLEHSTDSYDEKMESENSVISINDPVHKLSQFERHGKGVVDAVDSVMRSIRLMFLGTRTEQGQLQQTIRKSQMDLEEAQMAVLGRSKVDPEEYANFTKKQIKKIEARYAKNRKVRRQVLEDQDLPVSGRRDKLKKRTEGPSSEGSFISPF